MSKILSFSSIAIIAAVILAAIAYINSSNTASLKAEPITVYRPERDAIITQAERDLDGRLRDEATAIINKHFDPGIVTVTYANAKAAFIAIRLNNIDDFGGDAGCAMFGDLVQELCGLDSNRCILHVESAAPSSVNPLDYAWAQELATGNGAPIPIHDDFIHANQMRVIESLAQRGIVQRKIE